MSHFTSKDLDKMVLGKLDRKLAVPGQTGNPIIDRLRMAARKQKLGLPKMPKI